MMKDFGSDVPKIWGSLCTKKKIKNSIDFSNTQLERKVLMLSGIYITAPTWKNRFKNFLRYLNRVVCFLSDYSTHSLATEV